MSAGEWQPINDTTGETVISFPAYPLPGWNYVWPPVLLPLTPSYADLTARVAALEWELAQLKRQLRDDKDQT